VRTLELAPPNLAKWREGNTGIPFVWTFASDTPGPHCAIVALTHGNEYCGAIAADELLTRGITPLRGKLSIVFANVDAFSRFDEHAPFASRCVDEDFNRVWDAATLDGPRTSRELTRARALRPFIDSVDHLLDLHSMHEPGLPILLCGATQKGLALAKAIGAPAHILVDAGHAAGRRLFDYAAFSDDASHKTAYLVECGQHWEADAAVVAWDCLQRFLVHFGMIAGTLPPAPTQTVVTITDVITVKQSTAFRWEKPWAHLEIVPKAGTLLAREGERKIITPYDQCALVMPTPEPQSGHTAVRLGRVS
jgi:predicted deacylase